MSEPLFKACTRPAMLASVPVKPLLVASGTILLASLWANYLFDVGLWGLLLLPINYGVMRYITHRDDGMFGLLWLRILCRKHDRTRRVYGGFTVYSPLPFKSRR